MARNEPQPTTQPTAPALNPPRPNKVLLGLSILLWLIWLGFLAWLAWTTR
jgi:hypothetical protein